MRLDKPFPRLIFGMRLAGEDQLNRTLRIVQQLRQPIAIAEDQRRPFVGGKAAAKADRQDGRIEEIPRRFDHLVRLAPPAALAADAAADECQQAGS